MGLTPAPSRSRLGSETCRVRTGEGACIALNQQQFSLFRDGRAPRLSGGHDVFMSKVVVPGARLCIPWGPTSPTLILFRAAQMAMY
jgi:hypothetical protein